MSSADLARRARKGTVCAHCWTHWHKRDGHDANRCRNVWDDTDSPNGLTVCMCGCAREAQP